MRHKLPASRSATCRGINFCPAKANPLPKQFADAVGEDRWTVEGLREALVSFADVFVRSSEEGMGRERIRVEGQPYDLPSRVDRQRKQNVQVRVRRN